MVRQGLAEMGSPKIEELPWCGRCRQVGRNRLDHTFVTTPDGRDIEIIGRCPNCSPHPAGHCSHIVPPGRSCELCFHAVGQRCERPYAGPPPEPALPAEPIDIWTASIKDLTAELAALADPSPPRLIGQRNETELRSLAARQLSASRARSKASSP